MSGQRRPFLNVHRLAVFVPVWVFGVPLALGALVVTIADRFGYQAFPAPVLIFVFVVLAMIGLWSELCPRCDALITSSTGNYWWGWRCMFFAHEACPKCGLDLCAVTPWHAGVFRQRGDWIASLPQPRRAWIKLGALRIILTRIAVVLALFYGFPFIQRAADVAGAAFWSVAGAGN